MDISVIICTYNRAAGLEQVLGDLEEMDIPRGASWEILVVDNNSRDNTRQVVEQYIARDKLNIRYLFEKNQGLSWARNRGAKEAAGEIVVFTDDDVEIDRSWISGIYRAAAAYPECNCFGGRVVPIWPPARPGWLDKIPPRMLRGPLVWHDHGEEDKEYDDESMFAICGANMFFRKKVFEEGNGFKTSLSRQGKKLTSGEDSEFYFRMKARGERVMYIGRSLVHHPIPDERLTKDYFKKWFFGAGESSFYKKNISPQAVRYFGVPRWYYKEFAESLSRWLKAMLTFNFAADFWLRLKLYACAGRIYAAYTNKSEG